MPVAQLREQKREIYAELKRRFEQLKAKWGGGASDYDYWFEHQVNNAHLNSVATYYDLVPCFEQLLALNAGDMDRFYEAVTRLARKPKKERHEWLRSLCDRDNGGLAPAARDGDRR